MKYKINSTNQVIIADLEFVTKNHKNDYTEITEIAQELPTAPTEKYITNLEYMNRFTDTELETIFTLAKTIVKIEIWLEKFKQAKNINLLDPATEAGLQAMQAAGILTKNRVKEILS